MDIETYIAYQLVEIHPQLKVHLLQMDLSCKEDIASFYKLLYMIEALYLISKSKTIEAYYEDFSELSLVLNDSYYDDEHREDLLQRLLDKIDDSYVSVIEELVGGSIR